MSTENNQKTAKLFSIYHSDGNDRQETFRFKAYDIENVVDYITANWFIPEFQESVEIDYQNEDNAYIMWSICDEQDCGEADLCEFCEIGNSSFEILLLENPEESDYKFITIEGLNNFIDLTGETKNSRESILK